MLSCKHYTYINYNLVVFYNLVCNINSNAWSFSSKIVATYILLVRRCRLSPLSAAGRTNINAVYGMDTCSCMIHCACTQAYICAIKVFSSSDEPVLLLSATSYGACCKHFLPVQYDNHTYHMTIKGHRMILPIIRIVLVWLLTYIAI